MNYDEHDCAFDALPDVEPVNELDDDWCTACRLDRPCHCDDQIADEEFGE